MTDRTEATEELTIDELAQRSGVTVRNIRAHQSRGLLPPPEVRARTGYYGPEHLARLELIREMQSDGFNLKAIERLLDRSPGAGEEVLRFRRAAMAPFEDEQPEVIDRRELEARLGVTLDGRLLKKLTRARLLVALGEDRYEVVSPTLLGAGEEALALGVPLDHALAVTDQINRHSQAIADAFVRLFVQDVLKRQQTASAPERWAEVREALERLRPLATEALLAGFQQSMTRAVERAFGQELGR